jgi:transposase
MCMQPAAWPEPDPQIAAAIAAMYGTRKTARPLAVLIRDRLGEWLRDEVFAAAFGDRGRPGWSPSRLALVTVLQRAENLTDRLAADAVRLRLDWKYLLGLPADDPGFDHTVLAEFRGRVADSGLEQVVLDALLSKLAAGGLVKAGGRQRTDSTHVVAAVAALNRLELAGESVRAVLEALTAAHPDWLAQRICVPDFARRYGKAAARAAETTIPFQAGYARRAGVEGTMHQAASPGAHATAACPEPASTTSTWPARSTSSGWRPSGPAPRWTGSEPATWHASNSASPHDGELTTRILDVIKTASQQELG